MNFTQLNIAGWFMLSTQLLMVFLIPLMIGKPKSDWSYGDFIGVTFGLLVTLFALRII